MIVNLAVADDRHTTLRICYRLVKPFGETTNGQARCAQRRRLRVQLAGGVRPTVRQGSEHCLHSVMSDFSRRELRKSYIAADATHSGIFSELTIGYPIP